VESELRKSCTFKPDLKNNLIHNLPHNRRKDEHTHINARYLQQSTVTAERRSIERVNINSIASPGPGEYEADDREMGAPRGGVVFDNYEDMLGAFGSQSQGGLGLRGGAAGETKDKMWSFHPQTNEVPKKMGVAQEYLEEDVYKRLTKSGKASHIHALRKGVEEDENDPANTNTTSRSSALMQSQRSSKTKDEARRDFHDFLARQNALQIKKKEKMETLTVTETPNFAPIICENSAVIHDANNRGSFLQRVERDEQKRAGGMSQREANAAMVPTECTFQPAILRKSGAREARSVQELSSGDAEMREISNRALRLKVEAEELRRFSFKPQTNEGFAANPLKGEEHARGRLQVNCAMSAEI